MCDEADELAQLSLLVPGFDELLATNPALARLAFLAYREPLWLRGSLLEIGFRELRALVRGPRRRLAEAVGCINSESCVRILSKIPAASVCAGSVHQAALLVGDERSRRRLSHVPRINAGVLRLLHDPRHQPHLHHQLLEEVGADRRFDQWPGASDPLPVLQDLYRVSLQLGMSMPTVRTVDDLYSAHRDRLHQAKVRSAADLRFPPPPVPGNAVIQPLCSAVALLDESAAQTHCLGAAEHIDACFEGAAYFYRVLGRERATLQLQCVDGTWSIAQLLGAENQEVWHTTRRVVFDWLADAVPDGPVTLRTGEGFMDFEAVLDGPALREALALMHRLVGRRPMAALWRCDPEGITVEWAGVRHRLAAEGCGTVVVRVAGMAMRGLARVPLEDDSVTLRVCDGELQLGRRRLTCHAVTADIADLLIPLGAGDTEFLKLHFSEPDAVIEQSGLGAEVTKRVERVQRAIDGFTDKLLWTGIDPGRLEQFVWDELAVVYEGEVSKIDVPVPRAPSATSQLDLLGNADLPLFIGRRDSS